MTVYSVLLMRIVCDGTSPLVEHAQTACFLQDSFIWWQSQWDGAAALLSWSAWSRAARARDQRASAGMRLVAGCSPGDGNDTRTTSQFDYSLGQNVTEHNPAPSPSGHPFLSGPPT